MLKLSPAFLLVLLLLGGAGTGMWMSSRRAIETPAPVSAELLEVVEAAPQETATDLRQQIKKLEGMVEYLQGQVSALQDENSQLLQKLGTLGMKGVAKMDPVAIPVDEPPDFVGLGIELMKFRQIQALPVPTMGTSQAEVEKSILAWLRQQQPEDEAPRFGLALAALGWINKPVDPLPLQAAVLARLLGGWYDSAAGTLLVVDEKAEPGRPAPDRPLAVAFGQLFREFGSTLFPPPGKPPLTTDERISRMALITGDAALTRFLYSVQNPIPQSPTDLPTEDPDHPLNQVPMPVYLRELTMFPFARGFEFAQAAHSLGQFPQLDAAYSRPPASTSEVIEPERFLDPGRLPAVKVEFPDVAIQGEKPYWDDTLGRFATFTALRAYNSDEEAGLGTRGRKADRLLAYPAPEHPRDHAVWQTLWLTAEDSVAFFKAMRSCLVQRYDAKPSFDQADKVVLEAGGRHVRLITQKPKLGVVLIDAATAGFADAAEKMAAQLR